MELIKQESASYSSHPDCETIYNYKRQNKLEYLNTFQHVNLYNNKNNYDLTYDYKGCYNDFIRFHKLLNIINSD